MTRIVFLRAIFFAVITTLSLSAYSKSPPDLSESTGTPLDEVLLKNGSRIFGSIVSARDGIIVMETDFAGTLNIEADSVEHMYTHGSLVVLMADGSTIRDQPIQVDATGLTVTTNTGDQRYYGVNDFLKLNPEPWELGDGYKAFGLLSVAWKLERGNSVTDELDYKVDSTWRSLEDRYTLSLGGEVDESNGVKNTDNWRVVGKYDYFLKGQDYWGGKFATKQDEFADLDLRAYVGPYYGRQFYEEPVLMLSGELGLSYVTENFIVAKDQEYPGAHWDINISSNYLGGNSQLYLIQSGLWNLSNTEDIILNTSFGLSFPLLGQIEAAAEISFEYDSGAVEGIEELDQTYKFRIGYTW